MVICATEEERFRRIKATGFPSESIKFCLKDAKISVEDLDYITISRDPKANVSKKIIHTIKNKVRIKSVLDRLLNTKKVGSVKSELAKLLNVKESFIKADVHHIEHHRSHISCFFFLDLKNPQFYQLMVLEILLLP